MVNDLEMMRARIDTLFIHDERGRMLCLNDRDKRPAPRVYLAYTSDGYVLRCGRHVSDRIASRLKTIVGEQSPVENIQSVPGVVSAIQNVLEQPASDEAGGPAYRFPEPMPSAGTVTQLVESDVEIARTTFPWLLSELADWWPCFAVVQDGAAVSVCFSARIGAAVCEAGVETLPAFRRRGYAAAVTAAWAVAIRESGRVPLYSTSRHNLASQGVADRLGLIPFGADVIWE